MGEKERLALLESEVGQETVDSWLRGETEDCLWEAYHKTRSAEAREMETAVHDRNILQSNLETLETALEEAKTEQIPETARQQVWQEIITTAVTSTVAKEIQDNLRNEQDFSEEDLEDLTKLGIKLKQVQPTMTAMWQENNFVSLLKKRKWVILTAVLLFLTALLALLLSDLRQQLANTATYAAFMSFLGGLGSVTLASFRIYQEWAEKIHRWASGINDVINLADEMLAAEEAKLITQKEAETATERQKLESQIDTLNQKIDRHQQRMGIAGEFTSLYDFVSSRLAVGDYEERLGMLHRTQADLQELTDTLMVDGRHDLFAAEKKTFFPRGPARVVLFIDDLDRCPPAKVVEVLEAIQLLLGTKLFVIVLGLDTRYVTRALEKEYAGILKHSGDPSGLDYIEKIIQIPYRVRPIEPKNLQAFLSAQMEMAVADGEETTPTSAVKPSAPETGTDKPVGTTASTPATTTPEPPPIPETISPQVVKFHPEDFNDLKQSCIAIGLTPRSIKRLVNVLKLIKVFWYRTHQGKKEQETKTVINLLALSARYPEIMAQVFRNIEIAYRGETQEQDKQINDYLTQNLENGDLIPEQDLFKTAVANLKLAEITLAELGLSTFHLVRSFSFVGDPAHK